MIGTVVILLLALAAFAGLLAREMLREAVRREYGSWAPALARALVRLAGRLHPPRAAEWLADVLFLQSEAGEGSGLYEALSDLLAAPALTARRVARRLLRRDPRGGEDPEPEPLVPTHRVSLAQRLGPAFAMEVSRELTRNPSRVWAVYHLTNNFAPDPHVVRFEWLEDGSLLGLTVSGAEVEAVVTTLPFYSSLSGWNHSEDGLFLACPEAHEALALLAGVVADRPVAGHVNAHLVIVYGIGDDQPRWYCDCCD